MKYSFALLTLGAAFITACAQEPTDLAPGHYEKHSALTNQSGTTIERDKSTDVVEDSNGHKTAVVHTQTSSDPKGLFNKTTTESTKVYEDQ